MAIQHNFTIFCKHSVLSSEGKWTFVDVFQTVRLQGIPGATNMNVAVSLTGDRQDAYRLFLENPDGSIGNDFGHHLIEESDHPPDVPFLVITGVLQFNPIIFDQYGIYQLGVETAQGIIHRQPLPVLPPLEEETDDATAL